MRLIENIQEYPSSHVVLPLTRQKPQFQLFTTGGPRLVWFQLSSAIPGIVQIENCTK